MGAIAEKPQHLTALEIANMTRYERAELKRTLKAAGPTESHRLAATFIQEPPAWLLRMKTLDLLCALPLTQEERACRMTHAAGIINPLRTVENLTQRQRMALVTVLHEKADSLNGRAQYALKRKKDR